MAPTTKKITLPAARTAPEVGDDVDQELLHAEEQGGYEGPGQAPSSAPVNTSDRGRPPWKSSSAPEATDAAPIASMAKASKVNHHHPAMNLGWVLATSQVSKVQNMARPTEA